MVNRIGWFVAFVVPVAKAGTGRVSVRLNQMICVSVLDRRRWDAERTCGKDHAGCGATFLADGGVRPARGYRDGLSTGPAPEGTGGRDGY